MRVHISVTTKSDTQYIFTVEDNTVVLDRWEEPTAATIGNLKQLALTRLPNIEIGRSLLIQSPYRDPIVTSPVTSITAIGSY